MADRMNVFEAQKWAFSFADDHGMERSTIDMLICGLGRYAFVDALSG